jgi:Uncharacterised protein family (UPF0164)
MKHHLLTSCIAIIAAASAFGQAKYSNEFLAIGVGARAHGMGGAMTAISNDITSTYWNPAGLTQIDAPLQIGLMHSEWFAGVSQYDYLAFGKSINPAKSSYLGLSLIRFGTDNIPNTLQLINPDGSANYDNITSFSAADYAIAGSYATKLLRNKNLSVGGSVKVIRRVIGKFGGAWGFGTDFGMQYTKNRLRLGLQARDITGTFNAWSFNITEADKQVLIATGNELPKSNTEVTTPTILLGGAYSIKVNQKVSVLPALDLAFTTDGKRNTIISSDAVSVDPRVGLEMDYDKFIQVRLGVNNMQRVNKDFSSTEKKLDVQPNFGVGLKLNRFQLDYALTNIGAGGVSQYSHVVSVWFNLKSKKVAEAGK